MAEIARLADVKLSTVSNWRRRHESFPRPARRDGQESFLIEEVAGWLDGRKIAMNDLKDRESPGTSYGARFRRKDIRIAMRPEVKQEDLLRQQEVLWRDLNRLRGADDIASYADLVLGLLYLSVREGDRWSAIAAAAESRKSAQLLELAILEHGPALFPVHRAWRSILNDSHGVERIGKVIRVIDRAWRQADCGESGSRQWAGEVFEYLLDRFAVAEGKRGPSVITPPSVVRVLVEMIALEPRQSLLDPCADSGGFLLEAARYIEARGGRASDVSLAGQALMERTWSLAQMNLALHGVAADLAPRPRIALEEDLHAGRRFDAILANPPFNLRSWENGKSAGRDWHFGDPPRSNANFAWLQHIWSSLADGGRAAVVMANAALSSEQAGERHIRAAMVEEGVVEALIALPSQLFATTAVPVTVWLLRRSREARDRDVLFVDARELGVMISRSQRGLVTADIRRIGDTVSDWRDRENRDGYQDVRGFSAAVGIEDVRKHDYRLTPGLYVGPGIATPKPSGSVPELRRALDRLHRRSIEADATAERELNRIAKWIP